MERSGLPPWQLSRPSSSLASRVLPPHQTVLFGNHPGLEAVARPIHRPRAIIPAQVPLRSQAFHLHRCSSGPTLVQEMAARPIRFRRSGITPDQAHPRSRCTLTNTSPSRPRFTMSKPAIFGLKAKRNSSPTRRSRLGIGRLYCNGYFHFEQRLTTTSMASNKSGLEKPAK